MAHYTVYRDEKAFVLEIIGENGKILKDDLIYLKDFIRKDIFETELFYFEIILNSIFVFDHSLFAKMIMAIEKTQSKNCIFRISIVNSSILENLKHLIFKYILPSIKTERIHLLPHIESLKQVDAIILEKYKNF